MAIRLSESCRRGKDSIEADINSYCRQNCKTSVLVSGGGAFNSFLIELFKTKLEKDGFAIEVADSDTIIFKEALILAFLGLRSLLNQENITSSVTGSRCDSVSGSIHRPVHSSSSVSRIIRYLMEKNKQRTESSSSLSSM